MAVGSALVSGTAASTERTSSAPLFEHRATTVVRSISAFGIMPAMVVAIVLAIVVHPLVGLAGVVVVALGWAFVVHLRARSALDRLVASLGAVPLRPEHAARWENVVDGLGVTSGVHDVELLVIDAEGANALAAASEDRRVIVVSSPLIEELPLIELEGVAANLLGRLKDGSARYGTVVQGLLGPFLEPVEPAGRLLADGLGEQWALHTDLAAVEITRYPPGLAAALEHMERFGSSVAGVEPSTAHLWVAPIEADGVGVAPAVADTAMQALSYRAAVLREL